MIISLEWPYWKCDKKPSFVVGMVRVDNQHSENGPGSEPLDQPYVVHSQNAVTRRQCPLSALPLHKKPSFQVK